MPAALFSILLVAVLLYSAYTVYTAFGAFPAYSAYTACTVAHLPTYIAVGLGAPKKSSTWALKALC